MAPSKNTEREAREARDRLRRYNARQSVHERQGKRRVRDNVIALVALVVVATAATLSQVYYFGAGPGKPKAVATSTPTATPTPTATGTNVGDVPSPSVADNRNWTGTLTLNGVKLGIELYGKKAPQAVASFVTDTKDKYFIGTLCWRLTKETNFYVLQCGTSSPTGADATQYGFGPLENTPADNVYPAGSIVEARQTGNAYSSGHQFFITYKTSTIPADNVGGYTVFGTITSGLSELNSKITSKGIVPPKSSASTTTTTDGPPVVTTRITSVTIK